MRRLKGEELKDYNGLIMQGWLIYFVTMDEDIRIIEMLEASTIMVCIKYFEGRSQQTDEK